MWDRFVNGLIDKHIQNNTKILDAGCGLAINGISTRLRNYEKNPYLVGCDVHKPFLDIAKHHKIYDEIRTEDISKMLFHKEKWFDLALAIGVLTHMEKSEGEFLISQLERISKHIILTAPTTLIQKNSLQNDISIKSLKHKSTWSYKDFKGYNIRGFHRKGSSGGSLLDTWLYPPLYTLTAINKQFTNLTQYLVVWK